MLKFLKRSKDFYSLNRCPKTGEVFSDNFIMAYFQFLERKYNLKTVFGVPGDFSIPPFNSKIEEETNISFVNTTNEMDASFAACGYAKKNGLGVCCGSYGVNTGFVSGQAQAKASSLPVINIAFGLHGENYYRASDFGYTYHHYIKGNDLTFMEKVFSPLSLDTLVVDFDKCGNDNFQDLVDITDRCFNQRKPIFIQFPSQLSNCEYDTSMDPEIFREICDRKAYLEEIQIANERKSMLDKIVDALENAKNPIFCVGNRIDAHILGESIEDLSKMLNIPIFSLFDSKGAINEQLETSVGVHITFTEDSVPFVKFVLNSDVCISFGVEKTEFNSLRGKLPFPKNTIDFSVEEREFENLYLEKELKSLNQMVIDRKIPKFPTRKDFCSHYEQYDEELSTSSIDIDGIYHVLSKYLENHQDDVVVDVGDVLFGPVNSFKVARNNFFTPGIFAFLGSSPGVSLGVQSFNEDNNIDTKVITLLGDGGFQASGFSSIIPIVQNNMNVCMIIADNGGYEIERNFGDGKFNDLMHCNYKELDRVLENGLKSFEVCSELELQEVLDSLEKGPSIIHCVIPPKNSKGMDKFMDSYIKEWKDVYN